MVMVYRFGMIDNNRRYLFEIYNILYKVAKKKSHLHSDSNPNAVALCIYLYVSTLLF